MRDGPIRAIETRYKGYRFRSRLEARWAVFFDALSIRFEYEPEGYVLSDGTRYLPDFWLPEHECFIEIKGQTASEEELRKASQLAAGTGSDVFVFDRPEFEYPAKMVAADGIGERPGFERGAWGKYLFPHPSASTDYDLAYWGVCLHGNCDRDVFFTLSTGSAAWNHCQDVHDCTDEEGLHYASDVRTIAAAYDAARSARFEFGENGAG